MEILTNMADCEGLFVGKNLKAYHTSGFTG